MDIKVNFSLKKGLTFFFIVMSSFMFGQNKDEKQIKTVFDQLVTAYGSAKSAPQLVILKKKNTPIPPANYNPQGKPKIEVDIYLYTICRTYGKDSLNALSIVLSHELAHYYNDHKFCSDYAYANLHSKNINLTKSIRDASLNSRMEKETEADIKGFFYAAAAGYSPFGLQSQLIEKIYKEYNLPDVQKGYPSKKERIAIATSADEKAKELYGYFKAGLKAMEEKNYDVAITAFDKANSFIPYRENYNNIGVAKTRKALGLRLPDDIEKQFPLRFTYPIEIDNKSRLLNERNRALDDSDEEIKALLKSAQSDFEKAISLDKGYTKGFINLACVFDLLENPNAAIGKIKELSKDKQNTNEAKRILAIAYFHNKQKEEADSLWNELKM